MRDLTNKYPDKRAPAPRKSTRCSSCGSNDKPCDLVMTKDGLRILCPDCR